jgi:hypothetical protein
MLPSSPTSARISARCSRLRNNDPFFLPPGAETYKRDIPKVAVRFLDTGHFALKTHAT